MLSRREVVLDWVDYGSGSGYGATPFDSGQQRKICRGNDRTRCSASLPNAVPRREVWCVVEGEHVQLVESVDDFDVLDLVNPALDDLLVKEDIAIYVRAIEKS